MNCQNSVKVLHCQRHTLSMEVTDCAQASNTLKKIRLVLSEMVRTNENKSMEQIP